MILAIIYINIFSILFLQGQHIAKENLSACPECDFPCFKTAMIKYCINYYNKIIEISIN